MVTHPLTPDVLSKLGTDFERRVFKAALLSLEQEANALRLNHFATTLRELSRIVLARLAPDAQIKACSWYSQASGEPEITRKQRITYAVQAGLSETFVTDTLALDVNTMREDLLNSIKTLSKYTHIEPAVFGITGDDRERTVTESLEAFLAFQEMVTECRQSVRDAVGDPPPFHSCCGPANKGHLSAMYLSVASRTTHASDTLFCLAISSKVSYSSGGKLIVARIEAVLSGLAAGPAARVFFFIAALSLHRISPHR